MNQLPFSPNIDNSALARVFKNTSATYKFYWFLGIIEEIESGNKLIPKENIFSRMIANAWYPVTFFKLSFGAQDKIPEIILYFQDYLKLFSNSDKKEIYKLIVENEKVRKNLYHLDKNVPHKFLSPWLKGSPRKIRETSQKDNSNIIYQLYKQHIIINDNWFEYIHNNLRVLKDFIYWNLALFIQSRNPSTPDIINKLIKPAKRNSLTKQRRGFWDIYLKERPNTKCIFTNEIITVGNYDLDHFVPYSFVSHDLIWNLIPIDSSFNKSKNNKIPRMEFYFDGFYEKQIDVIKFFGSSMSKKYKEEYLSIFPRFLENQNISYEKYRDVILPLITVANNNGFQFLE
jgi:hypothetical protein